MATVANLLVNVQARTKSFDRGMGRVTKRVKKMKRGFSSAGRSMMPLAAGLVAAGAGFALITRVGMRFEKSMSAVNSILRGTKEEQAALTEQAKKLGATTVFTASQASEGMMFLARAGFKANEITAAMPGLLNMAAAGNIELAEATNIAATVLRGMGLAASDTGRVADVLAEAAANANTDIAQLGNAFSYVAPVARSLGISFEETAAAIGILSDAGIQGDRAGTGLRRMFGHLAGEIERGGLVKTLRDLADANVGAEETMKRFGQRAGPAVLAITKDKDRLEELLETLQKAEGSAAEMAKTRLDNLAGDLTLLASASEGMAIAIFADMSDGLRGFVQEITQLFQAIVPHISKLTEAFGNVGAGASQTGLSIIDIFSGVATLMGWVLNVLRWMHQGFQALRAGATVAIGYILKGVEVMYDGLQSLMGLLGMEVEDYFFKGAADGLIDEAGRIWDMALDMASEPLPSDAINEFIDGVRTSFRLMGNEIEEIPAASTGAMKALQSMGNGMEELNESVVDLTNDLEEQIATFGMSAHEADRWRLAQEGASDAAIKAVEALQRQVEALERQADLMEEGARVFDKTRTPIEKHVAELEKLRELLEAGAIDQDTFRRAVEAADAELKDATGDVDKDTAIGGTEGLGTALGSVKVAGVNEMTGLQRKSNSIQLESLENLKWMKTHMSNSDGSAALT